MEHMIACCGSRLRMLLQLPRLLLLLTNTETWSGLTLKNALRGLQTAVRDASRSVYR